MKTYTLTFTDLSKITPKTYKESDGWQFTYDAFGLWLDRDGERVFYPFSGSLISVKILG